MNIMTKRGNQDNVVTYEHMCDTTADLANIDPHYITLGSIAIVLQGESDGLEIYIAGSDKQWNSLSTINAGGGGGETTGFSIHICAQNEISNGLPNIISPDETTIYLVPATDTSTGNLYEEYIYVNNAWEKFGSGGANIDLSTLAPKNNPEFTNSISMGRKPSSTIGQNSTTLGSNLVAQGENSYAEGVNSQATGNVSHAEGGNTQATANFSHSEGALTKAQGIASHAEGSQTVASANDAHAEGWGTIANIVAQHVSGSYNIAIPEWDSGTTYQVGDMMVRNGALYKCTQANSDTSFTLAHWTEQTSLEPIFIVGNGTDRTRSNAYTLTREGSGYFGGNVYVNCNTDSSGGTQLATINDVLDKLITNPQDGDTLVYDATAGKWKNGAVDVGWSVGEQQLFSETVTTASSQGNMRASFVYATPINYSAITVVFENQEYTCPQIDIGEGEVAYGGVGQQGPDFSEYPFAILSSLSGYGNMLFTETAGTYTVAVIANGIAVTDDFKEAVINAAGESLTFLCQVGITNYLGMNHACAQKRLLYIFDNGSYYIVHSFTSESIITIPEAVEPFVFDENGILQRNIL